MKKIFHQPKEFKARTTPKSSHLTVTKTPKATPRTSHPGKNLGKFLHPSKMPTPGVKIGASAVKKTAKRKSNKVKGY